MKRFETETEVRYFYDTIIVNLELSIWKDGEWDGNLRTFFIDSIYLLSSG